MFEVCRRTPLPQAGVAQRPVVASMPQSHWLSGHLFRRAFLLSRVPAAAPGAVEASESPSQAATPKTSAQPQSAPAVRDRGNKKAAAGDLTGAVDDFTKAIELDGKFVDAWGSRGNVHSLLRQSDKALADCARAIELEPKARISWYNRGNVFFRAGQYNKAIADFSKAIELKPTLGFAWGNRGSARSLIGDRVGAISDYTTAIEINPRDAGAHYSRGTPGTIWATWKGPSPTSQPPSRSIRVCATRFASSS